MRRNAWPIWCGMPPMSDIPADKTTPPVDPREVRWTAGRLEELAAMQSEPMHAQLLRDAADLIRRLEAQANKPG